MMTSLAHSLNPDYMSLVDKVEVEIDKLPEVECRLEHEFTPGLYIRTIYMPAGTILTSKIHSKRHPYVVTQGHLTVRTEDSIVEIFAPHRGITEPGTRRVLYIHEDTIWTTFHVTDETDLDKIEAEVIVPRRNNLLGRDYKCLK